MKNMNARNVILVVIVGVILLLTLLYQLFFGNWLTPLPKPEDASAPIYYKSPSTIYRRDSLFIATTIWQFIDKKVYPYDYYKKYYVPLDSISINVDSIFYSSDSLKLFAFTIETNRYDKLHLSNELHLTNGKNYVIYAGKPLIGFRATKHDYWLIYNSPTFFIAGLLSYNDVRNAFREYYLGSGSFKNSTQGCWKKNFPDSLGMAFNDNRVAIAYGYNLDDKNFWDSSVLWKKGACISGYYCFQLEQNSVPGDSNAIINLPHLNYPKSLLGMYK